MTTSPHPAPRWNRRLAVGLAATAVAAVVVAAGGTGPADAVTEAPVAQVGFQCASYVGGQSWASISNVGGVAPRSFTIVRTGLPTLVEVLPVGGSNTIYTSVAEHATFDISVTPEGGSTISHHEEDVDCFEYAGTITLACDGEQPTLTATATRTGAISTSVTFDDGTGTQSDSGSDLSFTSTIAEDQPFSASLATDEDGVFATLTGTPDCADGTPTTIPAPTTTTTTPPGSSTTTSTTAPAPTTGTTLPSTTSTLPDPPTPITSTTTSTTEPDGTEPTTSTTGVPLAAETDPSDPVVVAGRAATAATWTVDDEAGPTTLPRTGSDTARLALVGTVLLVGGSLLLRRTAAARR